MCIHGRCQGKLTVRVAADMYFTTKELALIVAVSDAKNSEEDSCVSGMKLLPLTTFVLVIVNGQS